MSLFDYSAKVEEFIPQRGVIGINTAENRGSGGGGGLTDTAHFNAHVLGTQENRHAVGFHKGFEGIGDLVTNAFLDGKTLGVNAHQTGELGDTKDALIGDIPDIGFTVEGEDVMLAERMKMDGTFDDLTEAAVGFATAFLGKGFDELGVTIVAGGGFEHGFDEAAGSIPGGRSFNIHAQGGEDLCHVALKLFGVLGCDLAHIEL